MPGLGRDAARELLAGARVARLATVTPDGRPHVVPVTFAVAGDLIYSAVDAKPKTTRELRRLANIRANPDVAVLADHYAEDWAALWWARADGSASVLDEPAAIAGPVTLLAERYPQYRAAPPAGPVIAVRVHRWTGWSAVPVLPASAGAGRWSDNECSGQRGRLWRA
jgi:PPOX class probable F420-dependent enzyme